MDFDSRVQAKQYTSVALRENYNSNNISKAGTSSSQILDELRKKYDTPTRRQLKQIQTKPVYERPQYNQQPQYKRSVNMPTFEQGLARQSNRRTSEQVGKYDMSPMYKKENIAGEEETIFKKIKEMKDSLLNKNDKIKTTKSIYEPRFAQKSENRPILTDHRVQNIDKINSKIQQILSCLKQTEKKSSLTDSQFKNSSKVTIDNSQKTYIPNKSIGAQQKTVSPLYSENKNLLQSKVEVKNTSSIYQQEKKYKLTSPMTKPIQGFELGSNREGSKVKSFINSIKKQTVGYDGSKYQMKSGKKLDDEINKIQSKIQQFQQQKRKLNIQFKPYSYSNSKSTANLSKRSYTIDKNIKPLARNQTSNPTFNVESQKKIEDDVSRKYGYERYGEKTLLNRYVSRSSFEPPRAKNVEVPAINVQFKTEVPQKVQKIQRPQKFDKVQKYDRTQNDAASALFKIKLIPVEGDQKSTSSSRVQNRLFNQDLRKKADEGILDRKRKLTQNSSKSSRHYIKKLVQKLSQQATLDQQFRNNKLYFQCNLESNKWQQLESQLKKKGITLDKEKMQKIFKVTDEQNNPFFSVRQSQSSLPTLVSSYCSSQQHWIQQMLKYFSKQDLLKQQFNSNLLDLEKKGYIVLQDIVRFLNMQTGTFYRNRDLYLIFRRISQEQKISFQQLLQTFCK